jgi:hypothetical protein
MSRATPDDQLKFLLNCVKHSNNGKASYLAIMSLAQLIASDRLRRGSEGMWYSEQRGGVS